MKLYNKFLLSKIKLLSISLGAIFLPVQHLVAAQQNAPITPNICRNEITNQDISQTGLTNPSFWWAKERFGGQLLDSWLICRDDRRIDLIVNRQIWTLLDYLERYEFVNHFGMVAKGYGYSVRVLNQQQSTLATYTCNFKVSQTPCTLWIETIGTEGFRRRPVQ